MELTEKISRINFNNFIWHGVFLALASSLMDIDTIMPFTIGVLGGKTIMLGILISIMLGASRFSQIFFAPFIQHRKQKKKYLLIGINARIIALVGLALLFLYSPRFSSSTNIFTFIFLISIFSLSGSFANISYVDLIGKTVLPKSRKSLLSMKQMLVSVGLFISAILSKKILSYFSIPFNISVLFIFASLFLFLASLGFWRIHEIKSKVDSYRKERSFFKKMISQLKKNKKLRNYLLLTNTLGISLSLMPFLILYGIRFLSISKNSIGTLLIFKVLGAILVGLLLFKKSKSFYYGKLLYVIIPLAVLIPLLAIFSISYVYLFYFIFFLGGILVTIYAVTISGILLEITDNTNRALSTGLTGLGSIVPVLFPLIGGLIIKNFGFNIFFGIFVTIILSSVVFIVKLNCKK